MKIERYIQTTADSAVWEQVDEYTWDNYAKALREVDGGFIARYTDNRFLVAGSEVTIIADSLSAKEVFIISKLAGFDSRHAANLTHPGGFGQEPEYIRFKRGRRHVLRHLPTGETFNQSAPQKPKLVTQETTAEAA